ncbi:MAG TPA: CopG family transcriptional regulator [Candidatus Baltobacteraceae bacterium]|nr:CopG family transcriptional regulator [Candidatus Baltobacteraceae bacterium]
MPVRNDPDRIRPGLLTGRAGLSSPITAVVQDGDKIRITAAVTCGDAGNMKRNKANKKAVRATITFPAVLHAGLEEAARQKKVSLAWVVRDAAEKYLAADAKRKKEGAI